MVSRLRYILPVIVLLGFGGWLLSDEVPKPDLTAAIQGLQQTLQQLQKEIKDLQSSVNQLARDAKKVKNSPPAASSSPSASSNTAPDWQRAQEAYDKGRQSEDLKSYGPAIEAFTLAIALDPKNDSAYLHRGYCHYALGDHANAVSDLSQSLAIQPNNSRAYTTRALALAATGKTAEGLADANQAIQRSPRNPDGYMVRAGLHQQAGQGVEAIADYTQALAIAPDSVKAYLGRAALYRTHGQMQKSLEDCYKAIELNPGDAATYLCRAEFYLATGAAQPALDDINRAMLVGQSPAQATALLGAAQEMLQANPAVPKPQRQPGVVAEVRTPALEPATAPPAVVAPPVAVIPPAAAVPPPVPAPTVIPPAAPRTPVAAAASPVPAPAAPVPAPSLHLESAVVDDARKTREANRLYRKGRDLSDQERFLEAVPNFDQALQLDPTLALALNARGYAHLRLHQYEQAVADCSVAIRINPGYANAYRNRSVAKRALGDSSGARDDYRRASELDRVAQVSAVRPPQAP